MDGVVLQSFLKEYKLACLYALKAHDDFLLSRLGLQNGMFSAFELSSQSIEKLLKSYLFFKVTKYACDSRNLKSDIEKEAKAVGRDRLIPHHLGSILNIAINNGLQLHITAKENINDIDLFYFGRYPDDIKTQRLDCFELGVVDSVIFQIWDCFKEINQDYYYTGGLLTSVYAYFKVKNSTNEMKKLISEYYRIFTDNNLAYRKREKLLTGEMQQRLTVVPCELYGLD